MNLFIKSFIIAGVLFGTPAIAMGFTTNETPCLSYTKTGIGNANISSLVEKDYTSYTSRNVKGVKQVKGPSADDKIIRNPLPDVPRETMVKNGWGWAYTDAGNMMCQNSTGSVNLVVRQYNQIFMSNPMSLIPVEGWLEGTIEGDVVTLKLPQYVQQRKVQTSGKPAKIYNDYIVALDYGEDEEGGWYFPCPDQTYRFIIQEDGSWVPEDDTVMLGHCVWVDPKDYGVDEEPQWDWQGAGDIYLYLSSVPDKTVVSPEDLNYVDYNLIYNNIYQGIEVGFDNNDVYFKGLCTFDPSLKDALVKGTLKDGKIILPTGQYFGISEEYLNTIFFMTGESSVNTDENGASFRKFNMNDELVFEYDADKHLMTSTDDYCMSVTMAEPYYYDFVLDPVIREADPNLEVKELLQPVYWDFYPQNDEYGLPNQVVFIIPQVSAEFIPLDTNRIFYQVFVDGELFEFLPDEYERLTEPMTNVPFGFNDDWDFYGEGALQYAYIAPFDVESLSVRTLYTNNDGSTIYSPMLYYIGTDPSGIRNKTTDRATVLSTEWCDLTGSRIVAPGKGISIRLERMSDGTTHSSLIAK